MTPYLIVAGLLGIIGVLWMARKAGADSVKADVGDQNAKTAEKVADAVGSSPDSLDALREHVQHGGKL